MATEAGSPATYAPDAASRLGWPVEVTAAPTAWRRAVASTWGAFWASRVLVWLAGCAGALIFGVAKTNDPSGISVSFGPVGNLLAAPAVRWDSLWYLSLAQHGYSTARETAFFPLYPILMRAVSWTTGSLPVAGVLISAIGLMAGLTILHRLTELELGRRVSTATVRLLAFAPATVYLSAVYTEGLFLALSAGTLYAARRGRWATAGVLGALAAVTRVTGVVLVIPVLLMFFYGPRADRPPDLVGPRWWPRYRFGAAALWSALIPLAAGAFVAYLAARGFGASGPVSAQQHFSGHRFVLPFIGAWDGVLAAIHQFKLELLGATGTGFEDQAMFQLGALVLTVLALVATFRRLPFAYGAYALCGVCIALSSPTSWDPLRGLARYAMVLFPLYMGATAWAVDRGAVRRLLIGSALLLCLLTVQFATWHMVGTPAI